MFVLHFMLAAGSLSTLTLAAPYTSSLDKYAYYLKRTTGSTYTVYGGNGETSAGWPDQSAWMSSFDTMFEDNHAVLSASCTQFGVENNSEDEIKDLKESIQEVSQSTGIDSRFIMAIMMQESNGCVRAPTTAYSHANPGLMQSNQGNGSCNTGTSVLNPCPKSQIVQMLTDGTAGTAAGDGLKQCLAQAGCSDVSKYYKAARIYNSGSIAADGNLGGGVATHCYSSDIANRLTGWYTGTSKCDPNTIGTLNGSGASSGGASSVASGVASATGVAASATSSAGGVFAQTSSTSSVTSATAVFVPGASGTSGTSANVPSGTGAVPYTFSAAASSTASSSIPSGTAISSSGGAYAPGSKCTSSGSWNCIGGTSFQRCSNNQWSAVLQLSDGTTCSAGETAAIDIYAIKSSAGVKPRHIHGFHHKRAVPVPEARAFQISS
ncbi:hypothetical protein ACMFMG_004428 [Clarireedia jacksonii]